MKKYTSFDDCVKQFKNAVANGIEKLKEVLYTCKIKGSRTAIYSKANL